MDSVIHIYKTPSSTIFLTFVFLVISLGVISVSFFGLYNADGLSRILLQFSIIFPISAFIAVGLRLAVFISRKIEITETGFNHIQLFKTYKLQWNDIISIKYIKMPNSEIEIQTIRIQLKNDFFYIDSSITEYFTDMITQMHKHIKQECWLEVDSFETKEEINTEPTNQN